MHPDLQIHVTVHVELVELIITIGIVVSEFHQHSISTTVLLIARFDTSSVCCITFDLDHQCPSASFCFAGEVELS